CMCTRNSNFPNNSNVTIPRRRNKGRAPNIVKPELRTIIAPMAEYTMEELLRAPTKGYEEAIVLPEINADHFEIKTNLLASKYSNPFHGLENENPHAHINSFKRITSTLRFRNVPNDVSRSRALALARLHSHSLVGVLILDRFNSTMDLKQSEVTKAKLSIEEPPKLELKELPSHLEYAYLEENDKLPVIIAKGLKDEEKEALLKVFKSHKLAISWKITDIKG
ncbi:hypothetical protein Tco_0438122, partial [Tanacetum coccineum]